SELRGAVEKHRQRAIQAHLSHAVGILAADGPARREVAREIERSDMALLNELGHAVRISVGKMAQAVRFFGVLFENGTHLQNSLNPFSPVRCIRRRLYLVAHSLGLLR